MTEDLETNKTTKASPVRSKGVLAWVIIIQIVGIIGNLLWLLFTMMAIGMGGGIGKTPVSMLFFVFLHPIYFITAIVLAWKAYLRGENDSAQLWSFSTWLYPLLMILFASIWW